MQVIYTEEHMYFNTLQFCKLSLLEIMEPSETPILDAFPLWETALFKIQ